LAMLSICHSLDPAQQTLPRGHPCLAYHHQGQAIPLRQRSNKPRVDAQEPRDPLRSDHQIRINIRDMSCKLHIAIITQPDCATQTSAAQYYFELCRTTVWRFQYSTGSDGLLLRCRATTETIPNVHEHGMGVANRWRLAGSKRCAEWRILYPPFIP